MLWRNTVRFMLLVVILSVAACGTRNGETKKTVDQVTEEKDRAAEIYVKLGIGYLREGKNQAARDRLQRAIEVSPTYPQAQSAMAMLYQSIGQMDVAERYYRRGVELAPGDGDMANNLAVFLCRQGKYQESEAHFLDAIGDPFYETPEFAYANVGRCFAQNGDLDKGERYLRESLKIAPLFPDALVSLAQIMYDKQSYFKARAFLQRHESLVALSASSAYLGYKIETKLGDSKAARDYAAVLETKYPDSQERKTLLGG